MIGADEITVTTVSRVQPDVELIIPYDLAISLAHICRRVGGVSSATYRGDTDALYSALYQSLNTRDITGPNRFTGDLQAASYKDNL